MRARPTRRSCGCTPSGRLTARATRAADALLQTCVKACGAVCDLPGSWDVCCRPPQGKACQIWGNRRGVARGMQYMRALRATAMRARVHNAFPGSGGSSELLPTFFHEKCSWQGAVVGSGRSAADIVATGVLSRVPKRADDL